MSPPHWGRVPCTEADNLAVINSDTVSNATDIGQTEITENDDAGELPLTESTDREEVFPVAAFVGAVNVATSVPFAEPLNSFTTGKLSGYLKWRVKLSYICRSPCIEKKSCGRKRLDVRLGLPVRRRLAGSQISSGPRRDVSPTKLDKIKNFHTEVRFDGSEHPEAVFSLTRGFS